MSELDTNILHNGQLAVATVAQSGEVIQDGGEIDTTSVIQTDNGPQKVVKVLDLNGGGGGGGAGLPDQTGHAGEFLSTDGTNPSWQAVSGGGTATVSWFDNQSGTTLSTGLTIPSSARVQVYKNGKLLQAGQAITAKLFTGGSGKSLSLAQTAPISTANSWLFETELLWDNATSGSTPCVLCYTGTTDCKAPVIIYEVKMGWYLGSTGTSWDLDTANNSSMNLPDSGYKYKFRAEFTGTSYIFSYKKNGDDWQIAREFGNSTKVYCSVPFLLLNSEANPSRCYNGSTLNMAKTKFIIDGQTWFDGATAVLGTDYINDGCTMTEEASSTNDYVLDTTTGVITFADTLNNDDIAVEIITAESGTGGTSDYTNLTNKPSINSVTLTGNKTASDLGLLTPQTGLQNKSTATGSLLVSLSAPQSTSGTNSVVITNSASPKQNGRESVCLGDGAGFNSYTTAIGIQAQTASPYCTAIGHNSFASGGTSEGNSGTAIGNWSTANGGVAVGAGTNAAFKAVVVGVGNGTSQKVQATAFRAIAIGVIMSAQETCEATAPQAIQLGNGSNANTKTFQVYEYQLLDGNTGLIPTDRMARVVELTTTSVELASDTVYNGAELASVTFTLPSTIPANFTAQLNFTSGATATTFTAPATVIFEGNDCSNGVFTPLSSKRYSVMVYSDGVNVIGLVMGN